MANTIKFKRGSGSDPGTSDLSVGEIAIRTDTAKLFTKNDAGSVVSVSGGVEDGDKGDITVSSSGSVFTIDSGVVTSAKIANDTIVNADINSSAAIDGSKIDPDFGSQNVVTTGTLSSGNITVSSNLPKLFLTDANNNSDFSVQNTNGVFTVHDETNTADRLTINSSGLVTVSGNLDCSSGVDVTGDITVSGTVDGRDIATDGSKLDGIASGATNVSTENIQDIVGGMVSGNTETGITVTYQDGDGTLDFVVGTLNQDTTGNAATATKLATARTIAGVSFDGSANISLNNNAITNGAGYLTSVGTSNIDDDAVTFAKLENIAENHIVGRVSSGTGIAQELNASEVRTLLNVENGATAGGGATGGGSDEVFYENDQTVTTNYTITNGKNAMSAGPITINSGVTVTVGSGETLTIV